MLRSVAGTASRGTPPPTELPQVLSIGEVAVHLRHLRKDGTPNRGVVYGLIRSGKLRLVDPDLPITRWTISSSELRRYIEGGVR